jgi:hypothetical protein
MNIYAEKPNHWDTKTELERKAIAAKANATRKRNKALRELEEQRKRDSRDKLLIEINALRLERDELLITNELTALAARLTNRALLTEKEIVDGSKPWTNTVGVYFLIKDSRIVYVGQSKLTVFGRIGHHQNDKDFDSVAWIQCEPEILDALESLYIHVFKPKLNGNRNNGRKAAPLALNDLLRQGVAA